MCSKSFSDCTTSKPIVINLKFYFLEKHPSTAPHLQRHVFMTDSLLRHMYDTHVLANGRHKHAFSGAGLII